MHAGDLKTYQYVKISKSNIFTITILSLHRICSESNKKSTHCKNYQYKNTFYVFYAYFLLLHFYYSFLRYLFQINSRISNNSFKAFFKLHFWFHSCIVAGNFHSCLQLRISIDDCFWTEQNSCNNLNISVYMKCNH